MNNLNIQRFGSGDTKLVAVHGLGSASSAWDLVKPEFEKRYEFITLDLPGHGDATMKATKDMNPVRLSQIIKEELAAIGIDKFHLIGNSLGGWVSLEMAARFPYVVMLMFSLMNFTAPSPIRKWAPPT